MLSDLFQIVWDALMESRWTRRITFLLLLGIILYFWGLNWSAIGFWATIFALHESLAYLVSWWQRRRRS